MRGWIVCFRRRHPKTTGLDHDSSGRRLMIVLRPGVPASFRPLFATGTNSGSVGVVYGDTRMAQSIQVSCCLLVVRHCARVLHPRFERPLDYLEMRLALQCIRPLAVRIDALLAGVSHGAVLIRCDAEGWNPTVSDALSSRHRLLRFSTRHLFHASAVDAVYPLSKFDHQWPHALTMKFVEGGDSVDRSRGSVSRRGGLEG